MRWMIPLSLLALVGCAHKPELHAWQRPPAHAIQPAPSPPSPPAIAIPRHCDGDLACGEDFVCTRGECLAVTDPAAGCFPTAHFDFDRWELRDVDRANLVVAARCLQQSPRMRIKVEGHCDERGTEEYNLALGDKRAATITSYLESLGVPSEQVRRVSWGKLRPVCESHEETCWWHNRRAEVRKIADTAER